MLFLKFFNKPLLKFKYQWCAKMKIINPKTVSIAHASLIPSSLPKKNSAAVYTVGKNSSQSVTCNMAKVCPL